MMEDDARVRIQSIQFKPRGKHSVNYDCILQRHSLQSFGKVDVVLV